ncbi:MAG: GIY-YIG nuclease family protein [Elusimicrobiota bacterium]
MKLRDLPSEAGVYMFMDSSGKVIYAGKAVNIKKRVQSHFSSPAGARHFSMISRVKTVDFITCKNEKEALVLEERLIKELKPRYNISLRDGKTYPFIEITSGDKYPCLKITRDRRDKKSMYFGPFPNVSDTRKAIKTLHYLFPLRKCKKFSKREKPCLNYQIKRCMAPCASKVKEDEYREILQELIMFLKGKRKKLIKSLNAKMENHKEKKEYEKAAEIRDRIAALNNLFPMVNFRQVNVEKLKVLKKIDPMLQLKNLLKMKKRPSLIEGFDISHTSSKENSGASVRFTDSGPDKSNYRRFKIKLGESADDLKMTNEVVYRRMSRLKKENKVFPDILLIDGGKGQEKAARAALRSLKIKKTRVLALAKEQEIVYYNSRPLEIDKRSEAFKLLKRVNNEAHRFARSYHIKRRKKESMN